MRESCQFRTAATNFARCACRDSKLAMIDSLDWWTCRTRYYMCYRKRTVSADNRSKTGVYACGAEYLRLQYTNLSNFMTGDFDTWWMNAHRLFRMSHFRSLAFCQLASRIRERLLTWNLLVVRTQFRSCPGKFCYS